MKNVRRIRATFGENVEKAFQNKHQNFM